VRYKYKLNNSKKNEAPATADFTGTLLAAILVPDFESQYLYSKVKNRWGQKKD